MQTWTQKLNGVKSSQKKRLAKPVAGMPAGALMYISTPREIDQYIAHIPRGQTVSVRHLRDELAKKHGADCTCPLTTGIFLRIVAEAAFERMQQDRASDPTPFWRVIDPDAPLAKKLSFDAAVIAQKREEEAKR